LVADELRVRGFAVMAPTLPEERAGKPHWRQHVEAVAAQLADAALPLVLVGHSGACPLLPAIGAAVRDPISAYVFVDGDLPLVPTGGSRLDLLRVASPALADELQALLDRGGAFPTWRDEDLREEIPDRALRASVAAEVRPQPRPFWVEQLPAVAGWPDAPCGYLELSAHYGGAAARARREGWAYRHLAGRHFDLLTRPAEVADAILALVPR
jgi:Alpha/beta hydrolase family